MIFDFFTARLQRKKYETPAAMSMGFADFFSQDLHSTPFPLFYCHPKLSKSSAETLVTPAVVFAASGRYAVPE